MTGRLMAVPVVVALLAFGCGDGRMTDEEATSRFAECLERNGVVVEDLKVEMGEDGSVALIEARIVAEGDVAYEPALRLACTDELEGS